MAVANSIDISGLIRSTRTKGFTAQGALNEGVDNSFDAEATIVRVEFDTATSTLYIADNGVGMDRSKARDCYKFHADKAASEKAGLYGIGKPVSEGVLSDGKAATTTYTKAVDDVLYEVKADWVAAEADGVWAPTADNASPEGTRLWEEKAIDTDYGSLVKIPVPPLKFRAMVDDIETIAKELAFNYQDYLAEGREIILKVDGAVIDLPDTEGLGWNDVLEHQRCRRGIQVWKKGDEERIYHQEGDQWKRFDWRKASPEHSKRMEDYVEVVAAGSGWANVGEFWLESVYNPEWNPENEAFVLGYVAFRRNKRYLARLPCGTADPRRLRAAEDRGVRASRAQVHLPRG